MSSRREGGSMACRSYLIFRQYILRMSGIYLAVFCDETGVRKEEVLAWYPVIAAARLVENIDGKQQTELLHSIEEWYTNSV